MPKIPLAACLSVVLALPIAGLTQSPIASEGTRDQLASYMIGTVAGFSGAVLVTREAVVLLRKSYVFDEAELGSLARQLGWASTSLVSPMAVLL